MNKYCFNALNGLLPFLPFDNREFLNLSLCFNALNGLLPFLLPLLIMDINGMMFQRPERASSISTKEVEKMGRHKTSGFNALNGLLPFLRSDIGGLMIKVLWFQRPERASSISTR